MTVEQKTITIVKSVNEWIRLNAHRMHWVESNIASFVIGQCKTLKGIPPAVNWSDLSFIKLNVTEVDVDWSLVRVSLIRFTVPAGSPKTEIARVLNNCFASAIRYFSDSGDSELDTPYDRLRRYTEYLSSKIDKSDIRQETFSDVQNETTDLTLDLSRLTQFEFLQ